MAVTELRQLKTLRRDFWLLEPLPTILLLGGFVVYSTWAVFQNQNYFADPYLSPLYSPCLAVNCQHATFRLFGSWYAITPAILVLWAPLGFRTTCYYYRKAYYRAFMGSPPACAVKDVARRYSGETRFPFILQNLHRYFFWAVTPILAFLWWDVILAFRHPDGFGMGVGTIVLGANAFWLTAYSLSCHSARHLAGGTFDVMTSRPIRHRMWRFVTRLNERHALIAWISLVVVGFSDVYVRLVATDTVRDLRLF